MLRRNIVKQQLSRRLKLILEMILNNDCVDKDDLLHAFDISKRTLYYDLTKLNSALIEMKLGAIQSGSTGFYILDRNKEKIRDVFNLVYRKNYIFSNHERIYIIIILLLKNESGLTIERLEDYLSVSKNTVVSDLNNTRRYVKEFGITLESQNGYVIVGKEECRRALFSHVFNDYCYLFEPVTIDPQLLVVLEQVVDKDYTARYLTTFYRDFYKGNSVDVGGVKIYLEKFKDALSIKDSLQRVTEIDIQDDEVAFIALMILGNLEIITKFIEYEAEKFNRWNSVILSIIGEFERFSCIFIDQKNDLAKNIMYHLIPYIVKSRLGIYYGNVLKDAIKSKYSIIYSLTKKAICQYEDQFDGFLFNDDMISYIVLYFGALLHDTSDFNRKPKLLIACNKGYATSQLLALQIIELFPNSEIVGVVRLDEIDRYIGHFDFVITNDKNYIGENVINVESILTETDKNELLFMISNLQINIRSKQEMINHIISKVEENAIIQNKSKLFADIESVINNIDLKNNKFMPSLSHMLSTEVVQVVLDECDWRLALEIGSLPLLRNSSIKQTYLEDMISTIERIGPYFIIGDGFALAHGSPEAGVNRLAVSLTVFNNPVIVAEKQFNVLVILAPIDKKSHINIIADVNQIVADKDKYERIKNIQTREELLKLI